jgi:hypothetical protein
MGDFFPSPDEYPDFMAQAESVLTVGPIAAKSSASRPNPVLAFLRAAKPILLNVLEMTNHGDSSISLNRQA